MDPAAPEQCVLLHQDLWLVYLQLPPSQTTTSPSQHLNLAVHSRRFPRYPRTLSRTWRAWLQTCSEPLRGGAHDEEEPTGGGAGAGGTSGEAEAEDGGDAGNGGAAAMGFTLD
jgi:hypothetical protein